jgi:transcriptional regulator with XRE-family HTH domain
VVLLISEVRRIVERVCARQDVPDACAERDLGYVIGVFEKNGLTQSQMASLTGLHQVQLSNYKTGKHRPKEISVFAAFADGLGVPRSALAQRYFIQALALAQAGGDHLLGASILDAMSHQATYTGRFAEAANLARAAGTGTAGIATATLTAHFHTMEARALARLGDAKACDRALAEAVREFERRRPDEDSGWIRYFDEAELAAEFGIACATWAGPRTLPGTPVAA